MTYDMEKQLATMKNPVLIFSIKNDKLVGESNAIELNQWIKSDSEIITLKNTNHLLSNKQDTELVVRKIISWYEALKIRYS
jgi:esterase/lipase